MSRNSRIFSNVTLKTMIYVFSFSWRWYFWTTHPPTFGKWIWICEIMSCFLPKLRRSNSGQTPSYFTATSHWTSVFFAFVKLPPPLPPAGLQQTATSGEILLVLCRRPTKQAPLLDGDKAKQLLILTSFSLLLSILPSYCSLWYSWAQVLKTYFFLLSQKHVTGYTVSCKSIHILWTCVF